MSGTTPPTEMLDTFFSATPSITEHGPSWVQSRLPFAGRTFRGRKSPSQKGEQSTGTCDDYFALLSATLGLQAHENSLPPVEGYAIDLGARYPSQGLSGSESETGKAEAGTQGIGAVLVKANAKLVAVKSGKSWDEDFVFVFSEFTEEGRIGRMEIWADNLSAWMAVGE